jgi:hypothetical protein
MPSAGQVGLAQALRITQRIVMSEGVLIGGLSWPLTRVIARGKETSWMPLTCQQARASNPSMKSSPL